MASLLLKNTATLARPMTRMMSARPMTRFVQYPFDKTKMEEVRAWVNDIDTPAELRDAAGVRNVEFSFCPGQGESVVPGREFPHPPPTRPLTAVALAPACSRLARGSLHLQRFGGYEGLPGDRSLQER